MSIIRLEIDGRTYELSGDNVRCESCNANAAREQTARADVLRALEDRSGVRAMTERASSPSEGTCAACGKALGSVIENHIHGQRLYHASCCPACRTPPEQARVEQRPEGRHWALALKLGVAAINTKGDAGAYIAQQLIDFERDIRADMKRAVLAEIDDFQGLFDSDNRHARAMQGMDEPILDELKRRVEAIE